MGAGIGRIDADAIGCAFRNELDRVEQVFEARPQVAVFLVVHVDAQRESPLEAARVADHDLFRSFRLEELRDVVFHLQFVDGLRLVDHAPRRAPFVREAVVVHEVEPRTHAVELQLIRIFIAVPAHAGFGGERIGEARAPRGVGAELVHAHVHVRGIGDVDGHGRHQRIVMRDASA